MADVVLCVCLCVSAAASTTVVRLHADGVPICLMPQLENIGETPYQTDSG